MGRGQRNNESETATRRTATARNLLYGRPQRGAGPAGAPDPDEREQLVQFAKLVSFQLGGDGYIKGVADGSQNSDIDRDTGGRIFFDIFARDGQSVTRLEAKRAGGLNGLVISHLDIFARSVAIEDSRLNFHPGKADASDFDELEARLLAKGAGIDLDFVERELTWPELKEKLDQGQSLELVCDQDYSPVETHRYLTDLVDRVATDPAEGNNLIYDLGCIPLDEPERFTDTMYASQLGRDVLAGRGLWRTRRNRN